MIKRFEYVFKSTNLIKEIIKKGLHLITRNVRSWNRISEYKMSGIGYEDRNQNKGKRGILRHCCARVL